MQKTINIITKIDLKYNIMIENVNLAILRDITYFKIFLQRYKLRI